MQIIEQIEEESTKRVRLEARIAETDKLLIEEAAKIEGRSMSDFVVRTAQAAARDVIDKHNHINLSARDSARFVEVLLNPPKPNKHLQKAAAKHKELVRNK